MIININVPNDTILYISIYVNNTHYTGIHELTFFLPVDEQNKSEKR